MSVVIEELNLNQSHSTDNQITRTFDSNRGSENDIIAQILSKWNGNNSASIDFLAGADTSNKDDGKISFKTSNSGGSLLERLRIDESGFVDFKNNALTPSTVISRLRGFADSSGDDDKLFEIIGFTGPGYDGSADKSGMLQFNTTDTGGTSRSALFIDETQNVKVIRGDLRLGLAGKGIDFSGVGTASEILDYYEEGDFTPVVKAFSSGSTEPTYSVQTGKYTRIGRMVFIQWSIGITDTTGMSGWLYFDGLPFTVGLAVACFASQEGTAHSANYETVFGVPQNDEVRYSQHNSSNGDDTAFGVDANLSSMSGSAHYII